MLELLAAIQSVEPPSLVLWGLALFAAGMYPIGFMLGGSCSACCCQGCCCKNGAADPTKTTQQSCESSGGTWKPGKCCTDAGLCAPPCSTCTEGELPDTVTVTFNGFTDQTPGPDLISLGFSSCFGGGASARVTAPGGDPDTDKGPVSAVTLTNGGSGYAKLGRVEPTLTVSGGSGTGATFTPTLESEDDACGVPFWALKSVAFKGGIGYVDGEPLTITAAEGDTEAQAAVAVVRTARTQPTLTASVDGGSGAVLAVSTSANYGTPETWGVSGVSVTSGGTGYKDGAAVTFSGGADLVAVESAQAVVRTGREEPIVGVGITGTGSGADFSTTITETLDYSTSPARPAWTVSGVTITDGGSGYSVYDMLTASTNGQQSPYSWFYVYVSEVDEDGVIAAVEIYDGGLFYKSTGVIDSVEISYGGSYYDGGAITAVDVTTPGQYYREDAEATPYVAEVTVTVASQGWPSEGSGAEFEATVDDDTGSETFGQVTGLSVADGGDDYLAFVWITNCMARFDNRSIVLRRNEGNIGPCVYLSECNVVPGCTVERQIVTLDYRGPSTPATIGLLVTKQTYNQQGTQEIQQTQATAGMEADSLISNCSSFSGESGSLSFSPTSGLPAGASATVVAGGEYTKSSACPSYTLQALSAVKTTISWDGQTWELVDGDLPNYNDPTCDESYAIGWAASGGGSFCGSRVEMTAYVYGNCGSYMYVTAANTGFSLVWQNCRFEWQFLISITRYPVPPNPADPDVGYFWVNAEPIPVDEDGYPEGEVAMRVSSQFLGAGPTELTASFSRVLP